MMKGAEFMTYCDITSLSKQFLADNMDSLLEDIAALVAIPSVREMESRSDNAPFGQPIGHAFKALTDIATRMGLTVRQHDGTHLTSPLVKGSRNLPFFTISML